jgi:hypothetical protein
MTTHENVNRRYADLLSILREVFHAEGRGLVEMTISIQDRLPKNLVWELRSIGHIRNQVVHENLANVPKYFEPLCKEAMATLKQLRKQFKSSGVHRKSAPSAAVTARMSESKPQAKAPKTLQGAGKKKALKSARDNRPKRETSAGRALSSGLSAAGVDPRRRRTRRSSISSPTRTRT